MKSLIVSFFFSTVHYQSTNLSNYSIVVLPSLALRIIMLFLGVFLLGLQQSAKGGTKRGDKEALPPLCRFRGTFLPFRFPPLIPLPYSLFCPRNLNCSAELVLSFVRHVRDSSVLGVLSVSGFLLLPPPLSSFAVAKRSGGLWAY